MTLYGDFDDSYRLRPSLWRLGAVGFCQLTLGVWVALMLVSGVDAFLLHRSDVQGIAVAYAVPWGTLNSELARLLLVPGAADDLALRVEREASGALLPVSITLLAVSLVTIYLWPTRLTLARRLFLITFGQSLALFGAAVFANRQSVTHVSRSTPLPLVVSVIAVVIAFAAEFRAVHLLANVYSMQTPSRRIGYWSLRLLPGALAIAVASHLAGFGIGVLASAALLVSTLLANLVRRPHERYERVEEVEMREAAAALIFVTIAMLAGGTWIFRIAPPHRVVIASGGGARIVETSELPRELLAHWRPPSPPQPKIDIRWSRRPRGR